MTGPAIMQHPNPESYMPDPILSPAERANWRLAREAGDTDALADMLTLLARGGRWAAIAALTSEMVSRPLRVGWELHRPAADRYEIIAPSGVTGVRVTIGSGRTQEDAVAQAEAYERRMDALIPPHLR